MKRKTRERCSYIYDGGHQCVNSAKWRIRYGGGSNDYTVSCDLHLAELMECHREEAEREGYDFVVSSYQREGGNE